MKVYVIFEQIDYDYEGSSCQNIGVFISRDKAIERVRQDIPKAKAKAKEWYHPAKCGDQHMWYLEEWDAI